MSSYLLYTLETSRADDVTPSDALAFVAHTRPASRRAKTVAFGGNLVVAARSERAVRHACEALGVPRYAEFSGNDTGQSARVTLYERTDGWTDVATVRTDLDEDSPDPGYADYRPPANGDPAPSQTHSTDYMRHPAAVLQREYDFDTLGGGDCHPDGSAGVDERVPEPEPPANLDAAVAVTVVWQYRDAPDGEPLTGGDPHPWLAKRLPDAFAAAGDDCAATVVDVAIEGSAVAVAFRTPAMQSPARVASTLGRAASSAYDREWADRHGLSLGSPLALSGGDDVASALRGADAERRQTDELTYEVAWRLPDAADAAVARRRLASLGDWHLTVTDVLARDDTLCATVDASADFSPWFVAHVLRDALHGDGHPVDPVAFDGRPVRVSTTADSPTDLLAALDA